MKSSRYYYALILSVLVFGSQLLFCQSPSVHKVEPPNWWLGLPPSPMVLLTGEHLENAAVTTNYSGVSVAKTEASKNGHYLFVWLDVAQTTHEGTVALTVKSGAGSTQVHLPLLARKGTSGRFQGFSPDDVIYLIMPDRFSDGDTSNDEPAPALHTFQRQNPKAWHGGDLRGVRDHLSYLHDLGVTAVWLTPFWKNDWQAEDHSYHGYHATDFYAVDDHMGQMADLQALVNDAHKLGMKVILDYVVNHTGPHHPWITDPPDATWFHGTSAKHDAPLYEFNGLVDPHASAREYRDVIEGWFADKLPDLNTDDPKLAAYLLENAEWWAESAGLDAYRLDTFPYSSRAFWSGWHQGLFHAYPHTTTVGEAWNPDPTITAFFAGGRKQFDGIDSGVSTVFDFPLEYAMRDVLLGGKPMQRMIEVLQHDWLYPHPENLVTFFANHDLARFMSQPGASPEKLKAAYSLVLTMRGIPEIYYGDEIGMDGGGDPDNRHDFPGGFPGDPKNAFTASGRSAAENDIFNHVHALLKLRAEHPALRRGRQIHIAFDDSFYAFIRETPEERVLIVFNNSSNPRDLSLDLTDTPLANSNTFSPLFSASPVTREGNNLKVNIAPTSVAIYSVH